MLNGPDDLPADVAFGVACGLACGFVWLGGYLTLSILTIWDAELRAVLPDGLRLDTPLKEGAHGRRVRNQ